MKIVIIGTAYPLRGGIAHYIALLGQALGERHEVDTITFKRQYPAFLFPGKTQLEDTGGPHPAPAPEMVDSINPLNWVRVARLLRKRRPDLLVFKYWLPFFGPCFGTIAALTKRGTSTRVLFICDNILPHEHRPFDTLFTRFALKRADCFIVQSESVERDLRRFQPSAVYRHVPHPVYSLFGSPAGKEEARKALHLDPRPTMLFFGYIRAYKGLHLLLEATARVVRELPLRLLIVGEFYDDESAYRTQIKSLGLEAHVTIVSDYVPNDQVRLYFSAADAVLLPYLSATQSGIAQIALNFDKPLIVTDVGGLAENVRPNVTGIVVPPNNPELFADAILRFYREGLEDTFLPAVREEKKKYSWEAMVRAIEELVS